MKTSIYGKIILGLILTALAGFSPLYGDRSTPIDVNLIIDSSQALSGVKDEVIAWASRTLVEQILADGDRITVWSAGQAARVVFSGRIDGDSDREGVIKSIREISAAGDSADFSGALREASSGSAPAAPAAFSYTLLISASPAALTPVLSGSQANLIRFSRVEEFSGWRVLVVGLNLDAKVRRAAAAFLGS